MRPLAYAGLAAVVLLAGCATPREACINAATRELGVMDRLISETRRDIERGYTVEERQIVVPRWTQCERIVVGGDGKPRTERYFCFKDTLETVRDPKAIDIAAEQRKLEGMLTRRARMASEAQRAVASCQARYPS